MTTETQQPTHVAKSRIVKGDRVSYERIGVAFRNEDGSLYVKLAGTQLVSTFTLYAFEKSEDANA
jgi:hypothetical protein